MIHKLPTLKPYKHPSCNWRVNYTALERNKVKRLSKTFKAKKDAKAFYDLKLGEYKVYNLLSINELCALLPALSKWIKFCSENPQVVDLDELDGVVSRAISRLEERRRSQSLGVLIDSFLEEKRIAFFRKSGQNKDVGSNCRNLKNRLKKLVDFFCEGVLVCDISILDAKNFISHLFEDYEYQGQTVFNHRASCIQFFNYAMKEGYVQKNVFLLTDAPDLVEKEIKFYSLEVMEDIWWSACPEIKLAITLQAFCGVRSCEYKRLRWADINLTNKTIQVRGSVGKKGKKRNIILDDLQANQLAHLKELILPSTIEDELWDVFNENTNNDTGDSGLAEFMQSLGDDEGSRDNSELEESPKVFTLGEREYKRRLDDLIPDRIDNGFRHSFGTYHFALKRDWMQTTSMMGNSQKVLQKHYDGFSYPKEAENYFNIINDLERESFDPRYTDEDAPTYDYDELRDVLKEHAVMKHPRNRRLHNALDVSD